MAANAPQPLDLRLQIRDVAPELHTAARKVFYLVIDNILMGESFGQFGIFPRFPTIMY